jgi:predicted  nucleic acid-binding Zn-ribbon protein
MQKLQFCCRAADSEAHVRALTKSVRDIKQAAQDGKKELDVLTELNKGLIANQKVYKDKAAALQTEIAAKDETINVRTSSLLCHAS